MRTPKDQRQQRWRRDVLAVQTVSSLLWPSVSSSTHSLPALYRRQGRHLRQVASVVWTPSMTRSRHPTMWVARWRAKRRYSGLARGSIGRTENQHESRKGLCQDNRRGSKVAVLCTPRTIFRPQHIADVSTNNKGERFDIAIAGRVIFQCGTSVARGQNNGSMLEFHYRKF